MKTVTFMYRNEYDSFDAAASDGAIYILGAGHTAAEIKLIKSTLTTAGDCVCGERELFIVETIGVGEIDYKIAGHEYMISTLKSLKGVANK